MFDVNNAAAWATIAAGALALGSALASSWRAASRRRRADPAALLEGGVVGHTRARTASAVGRPRREQGLSLVAASYPSSLGAEKDGPVTLDQWEVCLRRRLVCPTEVDRPGWPCPGLVKRVRGHNGQEVLLEVTVGGSLELVPASEVHVRDHMSANARLLRRYSAQVGGPHN